MVGNASNGRPAAFRWVLGLVALALMGSAVAKESPATYRIVGYVADADPLPAIDPAKVDVLNYAFGTLDEQGHIVLRSPHATASLASLVGLRQRHPDLRIVLSVGGWSAGHFSEAALTEASRKRFADDAAKLIEQHDLDGLDVDWEYPTLPGGNISHRPEDRRNFSLMLEAVRARLDVLGKQHKGRHYLLTIASADNEFVAGVELARVARSLDWFNLMAYDFHNSLTPTTGHHAGLHPSKFDPPDDRAADKAVKQYLAAGVPASKLVLGVPFYGRAFTDVAPEHNGLQQKYGKFFGAPSWRELTADYIGKHGYVRYWDEQAQVPYLWNAKTRSFVSYEDPQSLQLKTGFIKSQHLGGAMYWEQSLDQDDQLLEVLVKGLHQP